MRGLAYNPRGSSVFIGLAPGTVCEIGTEKWELKEEMAFELGSKSAVYDILLDPRDWDQPYSRRWVPAKATAAAQENLLASIRPFKLPVELPRYRRAVWRWRQLWQRIKGKRR